LCDFVDQLTIKGRRVLVFYGIGDRRDQDLTEIGKRVSRSFDKFICFEAANYRRGRREGEIPLLLTGALLHERVHVQDVLVSSDKHDAIQSALTSAEPNDLITIVVPGPAEEVIGFLDQHLSQTSEDRRAVT
jgi:cyanophycin synthetase